MAECIVCKQITKKYKCPKCLEVYCSLECYKQHKDAPECLKKSKSTTTDLKMTENAEENEPTVHEPFKTEDTVPQEKLKQLAYSDDLKTLLYNRHLRNLLQEIDTAPNAWKAMKAAMHEPLFLEFADVCLKIIEPNAEDDDNLS